jgi:hypothetical protein
MRRAFMTQVVQVGRRGVLGSLLGGAFELGILVLKWAVIGAVVATALMVTGLVLFARWAVGEGRGKSVVAWHRDPSGYWRP